MRTIYRTGNKFKFIDYNLIDVNYFNEQCLIKTLNSNILVKHKSKKGGYLPSTMYKSTQIKFGKYAQSFAEIYCGFDIETNNNLLPNNVSNMYVWQFSINNTVVIGSTWQEFIEFLGNLKRWLYRGNGTIRVVVWVANLGFEWQFIKRYLNVTDYFFKEIREPIYIEHDNFFQFRECLTFGGSLEKLAKDYTNLIKLKGDLDYTIYRNSYHDFKFKREIEYCAFDVLILSRFSQYMFNNFFNKHKNPLTVQSVLRDKMKDFIGDKERVKQIQGKIYKIYPCEQDYNIIMNWLYCGGVSHADITIVGKILKNVDMYDITSSYPSQMVRKKYPLHIVKYTGSFTELLQFDINIWGWYGCFTFYNVKAKYNESIRSKNKCISFKNAIWDNGRMRACENVTLYLNEIDYKTFCQFYSFDKRVDYCDLHIGKKQYLPSYLVIPMLNYYLKKAELKKDGKPYSIEKTYVNSYYGLTVTRLVLQEVELQPNNDVKRGSSIDYDNARKNMLLTPYFGIWITSYAREQLLDLVYELHQININSIYQDTDSNKFIDIDNKGKKLIDNINMQILNELKRGLKHYGITENELLLDLGQWDYEGRAEKFKTLGCKRYLYTKDGITIPTIAGCPKKEYIKYCDNHNYDYYEFFNDNAFIPNCNLSAIYNDVSRETYVTLMPTDFTMKLDKSFVDLFEEIQLNSIKEKRIL